MDNCKKRGKLVLNLEFASTAPHYRWWSGGGLRGGALDESSDTLAALAISCQCFNVCRSHQHPRLSFKLLIQHNKFLCCELVRPAASPPAAAWESNNAARLPLAFDTCVTCGVRGCSAFVWEHIFPRSFLCSKRVKGIRTCILQCVYLS